MKQSKFFDQPFYCSAPFTSLFIDPQGRVSACCSGTYEYGNVATSTSLEDLIFSYKVEKLRKDITAGKPNSYCNGCALSEKLAGESERQFFKDLNISTQGPFNLQSLDIRWSTVCNFACIYCSEDWSSLWGKLKKAPPSEQLNVKKVNEILQFIKKYGGSSIKQVILAGGEPLLQVQNSALLDILPEDCNIHMITNFGIDLTKSKIFEKLKKRSKVRWTVSLENIGNKFEYIRQGGKWDLICKNIDTVQKQTNHNIQFLSILNILSAWDIEEFTEFTKSKNMSITWQTIKDRSDSLNVINFNPKIKNKVIQKLESQYINRNYYTNPSFIEETIKFLKNETSEINGEVNLKKFIGKHESKYNITNYEFSLLWPDLVQELISTN